MATVKCADHLFFDRIAKSAGSSQYMAVSYDGENLTVSDVTQSALEKALFGYDHEQSTLSIENEVALQRAMLRLSQIDSESVRPLRATIAGTGTPEDEEKLASLDAEAETLRLSLSTIS